jgi:uncharacterized membrane protein
MASAVSDDRGRDLDRTIGFSDGVFAIAITLLVLSFRVPEVPTHDIDTRLLDALSHESGIFIGFVVSFYTIARFWIAHHRLSTLLRHVDGTFIALNLSLLATIAFLPFPTEIIGRYGQSTTAVVFYALAMTVTGVLSGVVWQYAVTRGLTGDGLTPPARRQALIVAVMTPAVFASSIPIAFIDANAAKFWWLLLAGQLWVRRRTDAPEPSVSRDQPREGDTPAVGSGARALRRLGGGLLARRGSRGG